MLIYISTQLVSEACKPRPPIFRSMGIFFSKRNLWLSMEGITLLEWRRITRCSIFKTSYWIDMLRWKRCVSENIELVDKCIDFLLQM